MKTIELDDDLYFYIASQTRHIGESASDILRRLLEQPANQAAPVSEPVTTAQPHAVADAMGLEALLDSGELQKEEKSINRFMQVLSTSTGMTRSGLPRLPKSRGASASISRGIPMPCAPAAAPPSPSRYRKPRSG